MTITYLAAEDAYISSGGIKNNEGFDSRKSRPRNEQIMAQELAEVLKTMTESLKKMNEELTCEREKREVLEKEVRVKAEEKSESGGSERRKELLGLLL